MPPETPTDAGLTYAAVLTPPGLGAVAVICVSGPDACRPVDRFFHAANGRAAAEQPVGAIRFGRWNSAGRSEELVVCRTSRQTVEIHCHGGDAAVGAILSDLHSAGVPARSWREHTAAVQPRIVAEAVDALAGCTTDRAAAVLLDQHAGALASALNQAGEQIAAGADAAAARAVRRLLDRSAIGLRLASPWRVVLAGPPNVGKSSLVNALVGFERSLVFDTPGVTRDVLRTATAVDGWPVELSDTAGLRRTSDPIEAAGAEQACEAAAGCDLLVLVEDAADPHDAAANEARRVLAELGLPPTGAGQRLLRVANKCDLLVGPTRCEPLPVSAATGQGVETLIAAIGQRLVPEPPQPGEAVPFTQRHVAGLRSAQALLGAGDPAAAATALQALSR